MAEQQLSAADVVAMQERLAALEEENQLLRQKKTKGPDYTGKVVSGKFTITLETVAGEEVKKTVQFIPGYVKCRLKNGEKVWSEDLLALANLKEEEELSKEALQRSPHLSSLSKEGAVDWLAELLRKGVTFLREVQ